MGVHYVKPCKVVHNAGNFGKVAFFCTHEGGLRDALKDMAQLSGLRAVCSAEFNRKEIDNEIFLKIKSFAKELTGLFA